VFQFLRSPRLLPGIYNSVSC